MDIPPLPRRKTIRLQNCDYSQNGAYFVTICTAYKRPLFGVVRRGDPFGRPPVPAYVELSETGRIVESYLTEIPSHYPDVHLASYVIMPDHIHMILVLTQNQPQRAGQCPAPTEESDLSCRRGGTPGPPATTEKTAPPCRRGGTPGPPATIEKPAPPCRRGGTPGPPATTEKPAPPCRRGGTPGPPALWFGFSFGGHAYGHLSSPPPENHPPAKLRLFPNRGLFRHHLHDAQTPSVRRCP